MIFKRKIFIYIALCFFILLSIGLSGYIFFNAPQNNHQQDFDSSKNQEDSQNNLNSKTYNINDYIVITDFELNQNCPTCTIHNKVKKIDFKNLPLRLTTEFNSKQREFLNKLTTIESFSEVFYEINKNILSVYRKDQRINEYLMHGGKYNYYSVNINLETLKIVNNLELLEIYSINFTEMYKKILTQIADTVSTDHFLLSTSGIITAEKISINEFKENIPTYAEYINNRFDVLTLFIQNNKIYAVYKQNQILRILGMGSHSDGGLIYEPQTTLLN